MFNTSNSMTPADFAAISGNNDGFGSWIWVVLILLLCGWGNGNGWGGNSSGAAEDYVLVSDFSQLSRQMDSGFDGLRQQGVAIANGISSLGYDQLAQMNGINTNINSSTNAITTAINNGVVNGMQNTNTLTSGITALGTQLQECCCNNRYETATNFANLGYNLAEQSCQTRQSVADASAAITANQDANTRSILTAIQDMQTQALQDKITELTAEKQSLQFSASQQAQNAYLISQLNPTPVPSYPASSVYGCSACSCGA